MLLFRKCSETETDVFSNKLNNVIIKHGFLNMITLKKYLLYLNTEAPTNASKARLKKYSE